MKMKIFYSNKSKKYIYVNKLIKNTKFELLRIYFVLINIL